MKKIKNNVVHYWIPESPGTVPEPIDRDLWRYPGGEHRLRRNVCPKRRITSILAKIR